MGTKRGPRDKTRPVGKELVALANSNLTVVEQAVKAGRSLQYWNTIRSVLTMCGVVKRRSLRTPDGKAKLMVAYAAKHGAAKAAEKYGVSKVTVHAMRHRLEAK